MEWEKNTNLPFEYWTSRELGSTLCFFDNLDLKKYFLQIVVNIWNLWILMLRVCLQATYQSLLQSSQWINLKQINKIGYASFLKYRIRKRLDRLRTNHCKCKTTYFRNKPFEALVPGSKLFWINKTKKMEQHKTFAGFFLLWTKALNCTLVMDLITNKLPSITMVWARLIVSYNYIIGPWPGSVNKIELNFSPTARHLARVLLVITHILGPA